MVYELAMQIYTFINTTVGHELLICFYVDDGLVAADNEEDLTCVLAELRKEFKVTLTSLSIFLRLQYEQHNASSIAIMQEAYTKMILEIQSVRLQQNSYAV